MSTTANPSSNRKSNRKEPAMSRMSVKLAALTPITLAAVGVTQLHYLISHFATVAEMAAAVTVGAAVWARAGRKGRQEEKGAEESETSTWQLPAYQVLPPARPVSREEVRARIEELHRN